MFETPPALGLETVLKLNDGSNAAALFPPPSLRVMLPAETNTFDDKFLRFSVKKAVEQRLSPLGQFLIKVSRFATAPNVQSEVSSPPPPSYTPKLCIVMYSS